MYTFHKSVFKTDYPDWRKHFSFIFFFFTFEVIRLQTVGLIFQEYISSTKKKSLLSF